MYIIFSHPLIALAVMLFFCHAIGDYAWQSDFMAQAKNRNTDVGKLFWKWVLPAHAMIHAGLVFFVTNSLICFVIELVTHSVSDYLKCENKISLNQDQAIHLLSKAIIWVVAVYFFYH